MEWMMPVIWFLAGALCATIAFMPRVVVLRRPLSRGETDPEPFDPLG